MENPIYSRLRPLEKRPYKHRHWVKKFYCPLCRSERFMRTLPHLTTKNYLQIILTSIVLMICSYPWMAEKSFFWPLVVWFIFEASLRARYRKEVPCPYCGFDATWYRKDVKVARRLVEDFWLQNEANAVSLEKDLGEASKQTPAAQTENPEVAL